MKKFLLALLSLTMALTALTAVACADSGEGSSPSESVLESSSVSESVSSSEDDDSSEDSSVGQHQHTGVKTEANAATCTEDGNVEYWTCSVCKKFFSDEDCTTELDEWDIMIARGHTGWTHHEETVGVGDEDGSIEYWYCSDCEKYYADEEGKMEITQSDTIVLAPLKIPDFIVDVPTGKTPIVLQLTDTQIIDVAQARPGREGLDLIAWATDKVNERCYDFVTEIIGATKPDFIILTGDLVYGEFDDSGTALTSLIQFMESFKIPWAPVFGNHENESKKGVDWQCEQLENAEYCLFKQRELTGNGNYSVGIAQGGVLKRVFYMLDSNGCGDASQESLANGHTKTTVGFGADQIEWYTSDIARLKKSSPDTKISFAYHIQQYVFRDVFAKYGFNQENKIQDINLDTSSATADGDFGYIGRQLKTPWDVGNSVWNGMKALGVDSIFVGHEHCNSASVVYEGVRFQYGQKSSEYDRFNCIDAEGVITGSYSKTGTSLVGGTVLPLSETDGSLQTPYIYYCGFKDGKIDWTKYKQTTVSAEVNGLQIGKNTSDQLWTDTAISAKGIAFDETTGAYEVTAKAQGKLYVNTSLFQGKTTLSFTVYLPTTSNAKLAGYGEFAVRVKPNDKEPLMDGVSDGYIKYDSRAADAALQLKFGEWQTFTIDISQLGGVCTEFSFVIAQGNVVYFRDIAVK